jgi:rubrerythrin
LTAQSNSIAFQIRKIIYEKFNDANLRFTNDEVFEVMKDGGMTSSLTIDDMEPYFKQLHNEGLVRPIAQNFTTQWYKLFEKVEKFNCKPCGKEIHLGKLEPRVCPQCKAAI